MKIIVILVILITNLFSFETHEEKMSKVISKFKIDENDLYITLCINDYEYIKFKFGDTKFVQHFGVNNGNMTPIKCKLQSK